MSQSPFKNFFNHVNGSCYNNEKKLYGKLVNEAIGMNGVRSDFYIVDYNVDYDKLYGEDNDRNIIRRFSLMMYYTLPPEDMLISMFGIEETDNFKMWASKEHFQIASTTKPGDFSQYSRGTYPVYTPKVGDIVACKSNDNLYEIINVKDAIEENQFLQSKNVWEFQVRTYRDLHYNTETASDTSVSAISAFTNQQDYLEINDVIDTKKQDIIITSADDVANGRETPKDPFGGW